MAKATTDKTYILELKDGDTRKITIPATWKLTFGNVVPYQGKEARHGEYRVALRIYEGSKDNLRAVMTDVVSVRDASIQILEKRTKVQRQGTQKRTAQGMKDVIVEARVTEWVDPDNEKADAVPSEFLSLPKSGGSEEF